MPDISSVFDFGDAAAWGFVAAIIVFHLAAYRLPVGGAVALAVLAALVVEAVLMPLT
jgi:hypothetical protein